MVHDDREDGDMSRRSTVEPTEERRPGPIDETISRHPAYAQLSAGRVAWSGAGAALYGSDFRHHATVRMRLTESELHRGLHSDRHHERKVIAEWEMSEAQWATLVSSLNVGSGVPVTLRMAEGRDEVPYLPWRDQADTFDAELAEDINNLANYVRRTIKAVEEETSSLSKAKRENVLAHLRSLEREVRHNMPFFLRQFGEAMEDRTEKAKTEIHAYMFHAVQRAGLESLGVPLQLGNGEDER